MPIFLPVWFCTVSNTRFGSASDVNASPFSEKSIMRYLIWFLRIVLFLLLLGFAVRNVELVTLYYYFGYEWTAPLVLVILFFFALGVTLGAAVCLGIVFRQRRQLASYRRKYDVPDDHL
ncbi:MAG TPA: LapA family protein [Nitrosospira sp.]|nr:LapA family protein [Nitrosospira sp.]